MCGVFSSATSTCAVYFPAQRPHARCIFQRNVHMCGVFSSATSTCAVYFPANVHMCGVFSSQRPHVRCIFQRNVHMCGVFFSARAVSMDAIRGFFKVYDIYTEFSLPLCSMKFRRAKKCGMYIVLHETSKRFNILIDDPFFLDSTC